MADAEAPAVQIVRMPRDALSRSNASHHNSIESRLALMDGQECPSYSRTMLMYLRHGEPLACKVGVV